jgi:hypothetical protein
MKCFGEPEEIGRLAQAYGFDRCAIQRFRRVLQQMREEVCAENNQHLFDYGIPVANKPEFCAEGLRQSI